MQDEKRNKKVGVIIMIAGLAGIIPCVGVLAAIAIPSFTKFGSRSKQSEAKTVLKSLFTAQRAYWGEYDTYGSDLLQIGFVPDKDFNSRYACFIGAGPVLQRRGHVSTTDLDGGFTGYTQDLDRTSSGQRALSLQDLPADFAGEKLGVSGCPGEACKVTMACVADLDNDPALDVWSVSTVDRKDPDGDYVSAGQPMLHFDDTKAR